MAVWYWPTGSMPTLTSSQTATTSPVWLAGWTNVVTTTATTPTWGLAQDRAWLAQAYAAQQAQAAQPAYQRYDFNIYRPTGLGSLWSPARPALITHQEQTRRDEELYRRAVAEHDEQEATRLRLQIEARSRTVAEHRRLLAEQEESRRQRREEADAARARARELLVEHLTPQQRETFDRNGWFVVEGGQTKTKYRIRAVESMVANVDVMNARGAPTHRLCGHVQVGKVPLGDQLLAQKIMIELAEGDFLRIANRHAA